MPQRCSCFFLSIFAALLPGCISVPLPQTYIPQENRDFEVVTTAGNNGLNANLAYGVGTHYALQLSGNVKGASWSLEGGGSYITGNKRWMLSLDVGRGTYRIETPAVSDARTVQEIAGEFNKITLGLNGRLWPHAGLVARFSNNWGVARVNLDGNYQSDYTDHFWAPLGLEGVFYVQATKKRNLLFCTGFGGIPILHSDFKKMLTSDGFLYPTPFFLAIGYRFAHRRI